QNGADPGWTDWAVAGKGYSEFSYWLNHNGNLTFHGDRPSDYLVDVQSEMADKFIRNHDRSPFMIEIATFAPHHPYAPATRYLGKYHEKAPRGPAFANVNANPPRWLSEQKALNAADIDKIDYDFNLRVEAVQAVDDLLGKLFHTLKAQGLDKNTY